LVPDGATVQLGVGSLMDAVAKELRSRRGLRVRSGLVGDWLLDLHRAGSLDPRPGSVVTGMALGSEKLYRFLDGCDFVEFAPIAEQIDLSDGGACSPFISINSSVEVDLIGQLNSEVAGGRYVGAVGGQSDFFRATHATDGGLAIVALASTTPSGESRIVSNLGDSTVTSGKSDVDLVVTEWGVADILAASMRERVERMTEAADPRHRAALVAGQPGWL